MKANYFFALRFDFIPLVAVSKTYRLNFLTRGWFEKSMSF